MIRKIFDITIVCFFLYCCYLQLNDADGLKWIVIYSMIAILGILSLRKILKPIYALLVFAFMLGYTISNFNLLTSWLDAGRPAFIDYEPTEIVAVENIREFLGLIICLFVSCLYLLLTRIKKGH